MVIFKVFLRFNDKVDQHISNSHKPRIRNKIPFISSMLTIVMMPGCLPQLRALCSCCFSECLVAIATSCSGKLQVRNSRTELNQAGTSQWKNPISCSALCNKLL